MTIIYLLRSLFENSITGPNRVILLLALVALTTYKYRSHAIGTRRRDDLKTPKGAVPFLGHMLAIASIPATKLHDAFFLKNYQELGPVWSISLPGIGRMIQGDTPEMVEYVNKTNFAAYDKGPHFNTALGDMFGKGIITTDGEEWKSRRKQTVRIFNIKVFREYSSDVFNSQAQKVVDYLDKAACSGSVVDFQQLMQCFTLDTFGKGLWVSGRRRKHDPFADGITDVAGITSNRMVDPAWRIREALTGVGARSNLKRNQMRQHVYQMIAKHRSEDWSPSQKKKDLLTLYMESKDENGNPYSDEYIIDMIMNLTVAARDTTADAVVWMMYSLLREETDPAFVETLIREADEVFGNDSLRMFPALPRNMRRCTKDDIFPDGTKIFAGELFTWSNYVMGRSEKIWGPDVKEFKPSRWLGGERSASMNKANSFHQGPRACVGQGFAVLQSLTIMGLLFQKFELSLVEPGKLPDYGLGMTLPMMDGLPIRVRRTRRDDVEA
ncbi:MAG: cytochrome P450 [Linnemannia gamsii]|nr:MAG: cytochrome P450 [Linnemannia gamsii]